MDSQAVSRVLERISAALGRVPVRRGEFILLGLSGGPDSVALLHALIALGERIGFRLAAAHFNHRLRAGESDRDQAFARELCAKVGVELVVGQADGLAAAASNLEERAREQRYGFLGAAADRLGAGHVALAHHAGDQAETVLLRLLRGSGVTGLSAMAEAGPGRLIRPMLSLERREILDYLEAIGASFVTDSSNCSSAVLRNRLRAELIPMLELEYAPGLSRRLVGLAADLRSLDDLITTLADAELKRALRPNGALDLANFAALHPALAAALIRAFICKRTGGLRRFERVHIEAMHRLCLEGPPNGAVDLPGRWRAERRYGVLRLSRVSTGAAKEFLVALNPQGRTLVPEAGFVFEGSVIAAKQAAAPATLLEALFDVDKIAPGLVARNFVRGDRILPLGMEGSRKVTDVFIDHKVPRPSRAVFPLVVVGDEVVWIPGLIRGRAALVTSRTTRVVRLSARPPLE